MAEPSQSSVKWYGDEILASLQVNMDDALYEAALIIAETARAMAPVGRTGKLRKGIYAASHTKNNYVQIGKRDRRIRPERGTAIIASGTFYGRFVEFGTRKTAAKPFMRPAFDEKKNAAIETAAKYLGKKLDTESAK